MEKTTPPQYGATGEARLAFMVIEHALVSAYAGALLECKGCGKRVVGVVALHQHGCWNGCRVVRATFTAPSIVDLAWLVGSGGTRWASAAGLNEEVLLAGVQDLVDHVRAALRKDAALLAACRKELAARQRAHKR